MQLRTSTSQCACQFRGVAARLTLSHPTNASGQNGRTSCSTLWTYCLSRHARHAIAQAIATDTEALEAPTVPTVPGPQPLLPHIAVSPPASDAAVHLNQIVREGHYEAELVAQQAAKQDTEQPYISAVLPPFDPTTGVAEMVVVGCGPAGLALAAEVASNGVKVALIGNEGPFVNNYGVWVDEFASLGLTHTLDRTWKDAACWFGEEQEVRVGRPYGRVCRRALRDELLKRCKQAGVCFLPAEVTAVDDQQQDNMMRLLCTVEQQYSGPGAKGGDMVSVRARLVTLASGAAAGRFLQYEADAPTVAAQTAYGIEAEVEGYEQGYDAASMLFMDFRRHHTGLWHGGGLRLKAGEHPNAGDGLWGSGTEIPSFLYAMPLGNGKVFLEETCLVAKPALPFATLKRRLHRRLDAMGIKIKHVEEKEWSYIPVGGPLPLNNQTLTAFGAAANLVHPATGYSITRSLREAPALGKEVATILKQQLPVKETSAAVWEALWSQEKRRQAAFHVFGMELLCQLDLAATNAFFRTFFRLPPYYWRGFLASSLSSTQLLVFALLTFVLAPVSIQSRLVGHLITHPAGKYLVQRYVGSGKTGEASQELAVAVTLLALVLQQPWQAHLH